VPTGEARPRTRTKGERTAERILDVAEALFAERGFEGTALRAIADGAGIREPSLYNHFRSKRELFAAVLDRALTPMDEAMTGALPGALPHDPAGLAAVMTDLLLRHPKMAAFFQQALQGDPASVGTRLSQTWLDRLLARGLETLSELAPPDTDRAALAIEVIATFNLTTGYFLAQRALDAMGGGSVTDPANIARQKRLLGRAGRAMRTS
jgi:AcrR family transcriptional regulator